MKTSSAEGLRISAKVDVPNKTENKAFFFCVHFYVFYVSLLRSNGESSKTMTYKLTR